MQANSNEEKQNLIPLSFIITMKINFIFQISLLISFLSFGQEAELYQILPDWSVGDSKIVHVKSESVVYVGDTVFSLTNTEVKYKMEVIGTEDYFSLKYSQLFSDFDVDLSEDNSTVENIVMTILEEIQSSIENYEYVVSVDKETGEAYEVQNEKAFLEFIEETMLQTLRLIGEQMGKSEEDFSMMKEMMGPFMKEQTSAMIQTALNGVNYLLQAYSYSFPIEGEYRQNMMVNDLNAMGSFGDTDFPAVMVISSEEKGDDMLIYKELLYDKEFLADKINEESESLEINVDEFEVVEKESIRIDLNSTWIKNHYSEVIFIMPGIRVEENSRMTFK